MQDVVIIGAGGFGREVLDVFDAANTDENRYNVLGFIVDKQYGQAGTIINDKPILGDFDWFTKHPNVQVTCAIGAPHLRFQVVRRVKKLGITFCSIIHPNVSLTPWMTIGVGSVITAGCIMSNQIIIGDHVHLNPGSIIGHDVQINDFATLSPGTLISGNVIINTGAYLGTGATCIERKTIGEWSIIGASSTIINNVPPNTTVVGVPGRVIKERESGWHLA